MTIVGIARRGNRIALMLAATIVATIGPLPLSCCWAADVQKSVLLGRELTVLLFPVNVAVEEAPKGLSRWATNALQAAIDELPSMVCIDFCRNNPLARRAVREGRIRAVDVEQPVTDPRTAIEIGHALEMDLVVVASVQSYRLNSEPVQVEVVLSGQAYDVKANFDTETMEAKAEPQVYRAFGVVGKSRPRARFKGAEGVLAREALRQAAQRAAQVLIGGTAEGAAKPAHKKKNKAWRWFIFLAVAAALVAAANSSTSHHGTSVSSSDYRPRNFSATTQPAGQNAIMLTWQPPKVTANMLGYEIQRAYTTPTSTTPTPWTRIASPLQLGPSATSWVDTGLSASYVYYYRIRARYSDRTPSDKDWVSIGGVRFSSR